MIFEDPRTAKEVARCFKVFFRVKEDWRRMNGRGLPAVFVDFKEVARFLLYKRSSATSTRRYSIEVFEEEH